ncbi:hypothetical protein O6H91_16G038000 [Diphasiastrum complanatum]|uniref:Uncharacterized protein n=2 Tax=Diphasiastrum complanatum TaxID=34168 RepID=A0ACC2BCG2_DIPCM|nr:hypothetical protein O6H91_16G038000 [Diphasiastrum complanatum]KAJ7527118.1 hypothetical protein O6H91_16G038000 [Diphasiastrum complanatum]
MEKTYLRSLSDLRSTSYMRYCNGCCSRLFIGHDPCLLFDAKISQSFSFKRSGETAHRLSVKAQVKGDPADERWQDRNSPFGVFHEKGDLVAGKYKIIRVLGQGGLGTTYEAEVESGDTFALKAMSLRNMKGWKDLDLFEREARVLKSLKHPGIPEYFDYFEVDSDMDRAFYICQKVARGKSLAELVQSGRRVTEAEVICIALEILDVLLYLGSLRPPVIHRDIKPENIILDEATGKVKVVDFGAVQDAASVTLIGSTIVGTYGYMAPEQFQNRATLQTDLYGLGGTILYLLSGRSPSSFTQRRLKVDFRDSVRMSSGLADIIEGMLEPAPEDRYQSAEEVIAALQDPNNNRPNLNHGIPDMDKKTAKRVARPFGTKVVISRTPNCMKVIVPPVGITGETAGTGSFAVAWNAFLLFWTGSAIRGGAPVIFTLFSLPFWFVGFGLARNVLSSLSVSIIMEFRQSEFSLEWCVGNIWKHQITGETKNITSVHVEANGEQSRRVITCCMIQDGVKKYSFGFGLETIEKYWLVQEINDYLGLGQAEPFRILLHTSNLGERRDI